jgi:hypothetical protein
VIQQCALYIFIFSLLLALFLRLIKYSGYYISLLHVTVASIVFSSRNLEEVKDVYRIATKLRQFDGYLDVVQYSLYSGGEIISNTLFYLFINTTGSVRIGYFLFTFTSLYILSYSIYGICSINLIKKYYYFLYPLILSSSSFIFLYGNVIYQGMSLSVSLYAIYKYEKKVDIKYFIILSVAAVLIHLGSVIVILVYLLTRSSGNEKRKLRTETALAVMLFSAFSLYFWDDIYSKIRLYFAYSSEKNMIPELFISSSTSILLVILKRNQIYRLYTGLVVLAILSVSVETISSRIINYADVLCPIMVFLFVKKVSNSIIKNKYSKYLMIILTTIAAVVYNQLIYSHPSVINTFPF